MTLKAKHDNSPKIILVHGFGGGAAVFMRMAPLLQDYFEVILIDLLGMGASGRPPFDRSMETVQTVNYFTDSLFKCFEITGISKEKFYLLGHSFGGYIAGEYALKYPN